MSTISGRESELIRAAHELVKSMDSWSVEKRELAHQRFREAAIAYARSVGMVEREAL
jgi:hypothetical protein